MFYPVEDFRELTWQALRDYSMSGQEKHLTLERLMSYSLNYIRNYRVPYFYYFFSKIILLQNKTVIQQKINFSILLVFIFIQFIYNICQYYIRLI
jgi:hypothetical protein